MGIAFSLVLIALDFYLLRKRKINGKGFVLWFTIAAVVGLLFVTPPLLSFVSRLFGTEFSISAFVAAGFMFLLLLTFYLYYKISELRSLLMKLAVEVSVAKFSEKQSDSNDLTPKKRKNKQK
ncbi:hypothetical protein DRO69_06935 [Candidatus Bathyarchaeota archaeon]|nr:MAG: hypothetical protein DRO69_06935 [Candidatus Bathyarchaeota archaeon]